MGFTLHSSFLRQGLETLDDLQLHPIGVRQLACCCPWACKSEALSSKQADLVAGLGREGALQTTSVLSPLLTCTDSDLVISARSTDLSKWNGVQVHSYYAIHDFCFHCFLPKFCSELWLEEPDGQIIVDLWGLTLYVLYAFLSSAIHYTILCTSQCFPLKL